MSRRRAFALPLVVLIAMVAAIMTAVMLERQAAQQLSVNRQVERYVVHHAGRGIKEVVGTWLRTVQNEPIENLTGPSGRALDIELKDGRTVSVFLTEAQGTALADFSGLDASKAAGAAGIVERLRASVGTDDIGKLVRPAGPVTISANTAPFEVLRAAAAAVLDEAAAERYANIIIRERRDGKLPTGKLTSSALEAGGTDEQRRELAEWITDKPTLYRLTAELRGPSTSVSDQVMVVGATKVLDKYAGLIVLESKQGGRGGGTSQADLLNPLGIFLTWDRRPFQEGDGPE